MMIRFLLIIYSSVLFSTEYTIVKNWNPSCCSENQSRECLKRAQKFILELKSLNSPYYNDKKDDPALIGNGKNFWNHFCEIKSTDLKEDFQKTKITIHDYMFGEKFFEKESADPKMFKEFQKNLIEVTKNLSDDKNDEDLAKALFIRYLHRIYNGWSDIGYHYIVGESSKRVFIGRDPSKQGAHVFGYNKGNLGIVLIGNKYRTNDKSINSHQAKILKSFISDLSTKHRILPLKIFTHHEQDSRRVCGKGIIQNFILKEYRK